MAQGLDHLLDRLGYSERARELHEALTRSGATFWVELDQLAGAGRDFSAAVVERDKHWRVKVRRPPEPDT